MFQFLFFSLCPASKGAGGHKELGEGRNKTADLNWPRGYSIPYDIIKKESLKKRANSGGFLPLLRK